MKKIVLLLFCLIANRTSFGQMQTPVDSTTANAVIQKCALTFPKFYREFQYIKTHDALIKKIAFFRSAKGGGSPASAGPAGLIRIDITYLETPQTGFDDNRLIVVLYHEIGHLHYFVTSPRDKWNPDDNEKAAFEYSLLKTKEIAENGDCLPLQTGFKFMKIRSEGSNLQDPHVRALKRMVTEPLYFNYLKYIDEHCGGPLK